MTDKASASQPKPKPGKVAIYPLVLEDVKARAEVGKAKYGVALQSHNGRDALMDAYQEAIDLTLYLRQAIEEREVAISTEYRQYLRSDQWQAKRLEALRQADYRCELCNQAKPLQVHHLTYERIFNERSGDLQAVCDSCHRRLHTVRPWWLRLVRRLILK